MVYNLSQIEQMFYFLHIHSYYYKTNNEICQERKDETYV